MSGIALISRPLRMRFAWLAGKAARHVPSRCCGYSILAMGGCRSACSFWDARPGFPGLGTSALHALTVGAMGTMILAVMTRATLGHTNRELTADRGTPRSTVGDACGRGADRRAVSRVRVYAGARYRRCRLDRGVRAIRRSLPAPVRPTLTGQHHPGGRYPICRPWHPNRLRRLATWYRGFAEREQAVPSRLISTAKIRRETFLTNHAFSQGQVLCREVTKRTVFFACSAALSM